jgi:hypothetical protein
MATAEEYAQWIVANAALKGTPDFETVAQAYTEAKAQNPVAPQQKPEDIGIVSGTTAALGRGFESFGDVYGGLKLGATHTLGSDEAAAQSAEVLHPLPSVYPPATSMLANPTSFFSVEVPRLPQNNPVPAGNRMKLKRATAPSLLPQRPEFVFAFDGCAVPVIELWTWSM